MHDPKHQRRREPFPPGRFDHGILKSQRIEKLQCQLRMAILVGRAQSWKRSPQQPQALAPIPPPLGHEGSQSFGRSLLAYLALKQLKLCGG
jgi:hypothetical protein